MGSINGNSCKKLFTVATAPLRPLIDESDAINAVGIVHMKHSPAAKIRVANYETSSLKNFPVFTSSMSIIPVAIRLNKTPSCKSL